jgi:hypothetical protein
MGLGRGGRSLTTPRKAWNKKYPDFWICKECKKKFPNKTGHIRRFCSKNCYWVAKRRTSKKGLKYKQGLFQAKEKHHNWKGGKPNCIGCGKQINWGRKTNRCRECSYVWSRGKNAPNWQGGITEQKYPYVFRKLRKKIRERDNYVCQMCGIFQKDCKRKLDVHHIDFNKDNLELNNLISLCNKCHAQTFIKREYWQKILSASYS